MSGPWARVVGVVNNLEEFRVARLDEHDACRVCLKETASICWPSWPNFRSWVSIALIDTSRLQSPENSKVSIALIAKYGDTLCWALIRVLTDQFREFSE